MLAYSHTHDAGDSAMDEQQDATEQTVHQKVCQEETEGFTRSISLYWNWVRGQKAAARVGKGLGHNSTALILQCEHWLEAADPKHRYGTNLRPYFDVWLNQQARGRNAVATHQSYIPYSAIPEIAAQAAAEAEAASSQAANNNNAERQAQLPAGAVAADSSACRDAGGGSSNGEQQQQQRHEAPPSTPRRSRSAPNLADLFSIEEAEQSDGLQDEVVVDADAAADVREQGSSSSEAGAAAHPAAAAPAGSSSSSSSSKFHQQLQPAVSAFLSFVGRGSASSSLPGIHTDDRFFYWLDEGSGRHVDLAERGVSRSKLECERVQYLTEAERDQLEVTVDRSSGRLVYVVSGQTVHTGFELSLVQLRPPEQQAAAAGAAAAADSIGPCAAACCDEVLVQDRSLQRILEVPAEEEEEEEEEEQHEEDEGPGSQQKQQRQRQRQQLQQMQQTIRQPQQEQQQGLQKQQLAGQQHSVVAAALQEQQQQQQRADADMVMEDAEAAPGAAALQRVLFGTPSKPAAAAAASSTGGADPAGTAIPSAAAYGSVAGQATPGTTGVSQRRKPPLLSADQQQAAEPLVQQQHLPSPVPQQQQQQQPVLQPVLQQANGVQQQTQQQQQQQQPAAGLLKIKEKPCKWIYVLDTAKRLFVHAKYRGKFHHSSFLQGGAVLSAGGIVVERGRIMKLTADSGHYRPNFESFMFTVQLLKDMGADLRQTKLSAKHIKCPQLPETNPGSH